MSIGGLFRNVRRTSERGFTLEATFLVMLLIGVLVVIAFAGAVTTVRTSNLDYRNARVSYAAEAAAEDIMAQVKSAMVDGLVTDQDLQAITPPVVPGFTIEGFSAQKVGTPGKVTLTDGSFAGLYAVQERGEITASAVDAIGNRSRVAVGLKMQSIPLFQFSVFFEGDIELGPGKRTDYEGWVHSNGTIYASSEGTNESGNTSPGQPDSPSRVVPPLGTTGEAGKVLVFHGGVTTPKQYINDEKSYPDADWNTFIKNAAGVAKYLTFDSKSKPLAADFKAASNAAFDGRLKTDAFGVPALRVPLPNGIEPWELLRPQEDSDGDLERANKFAWRADWYIKVPLAGLADGPCPFMVSKRPDPKVTPTGADCQMFTWTWDAFFDPRELRYVDVLQIDIDQLTKWGKGNLATQNTQVLYVTFTPEGTYAPGAGQDPKGDGVFPVVRLKNGRQIHSGQGLTIATDRPLYVWGDYNTVNWVPAALVGDANTVLSNGWTEANAKCNEVGLGPYQKNKQHIKDACPGYAVKDGSGQWRLSTTMRNKLRATPTAVSAAILAGHQQTPCYHAAPGCAGDPKVDGATDGSYYKGGGTADLMTNVEAWENLTMTYVGSLVSLHTRRYAQGKWAQAQSTAATRELSYDVRFDDPKNLPPATPSVGTVIQTSFRPIY